MSEVYKIVTEMTKKEGDVWITPHENAYTYFTQEEVEGTIIPYKEYVASLTGMLVDQNSVEKIGDNTLKLTTVFDSEQHARDAEQKLSKTSDVDIVQKRNRLFINKLVSLGIRYTVKKYFEFPGQEPITIG